MPFALARHVLLCLAASAPALLLRLTGTEVPPAVAMLSFGAAIFAAAFLLAWAAEAAQKDISGALAIALLALIAVLPEYAVDLYYAFRSGSDPECLQFAAANMTGSNRLLLGLGWPLVAFVSLSVAGRVAARAGEPAPRFLALPADSRLAIGFLMILGLVAFAVPLMGAIPLWFGLGLIAFFGFYLLRSARSHGSTGDETVGTAALIANMSATPRRVTVGMLFVVSALIILLSAEPFADALIESGNQLGIDSYFLVQWLAPLASEAPEFIIATMFAARGMGAAAVGTLVASKVNQWSLLVGSLPLAHLAGGGSTSLVLDARQIEEFTLTATQTLLGVGVLLSLRFHRASAFGLVLFFAAQFAVTDVTGRYVLSALQAVCAIALFVAHRQEVLPTLAAPFQRNEHEASRASLQVKERG